MFGVQGLCLVLGEVVQGDTMADCPRAFLKGQHSGQHLEQGALPGTVFSHKRNALTTFDRTIDFLIDHFLPIALCHALEFQDLPAARCG